MKFLDGKLKNQLDEPALLAKGRARGSRPAMTGSLPSRAPGPAWFGRMAARLGSRLASRRSGRPEMPPGTWLRFHLLGLLVPLVVALEAVAGLGRFVPDVDQFLSTNLRMLEHPAPQLLVLALVLSVAVGGLGARRTGVVLALLALLAGAGIVRDYRAMRGPVATGDGDLRLLWFNVWGETATSPERIVAAIRASGADVVMLAEAAPLRAAAAGLADLYPYRLGCAEAGPCGLLLLSRVPVGQGRFNDFPSGPDRMVRGLLAVPGHGTVALAGIHETKPWYLGLTGGESEAVRWGLRWNKALPMVVAGDFNAAPWSLRMRRLQREHGLGFAVWPVPTWPVPAGRFGVPIDHVMVRGGPAIIRLLPWGADLGSNHRGLIAEITLP